MADWHTASADERASQAASLAEERSQYHAAATDERVRQQTSYLDERASQAASLAEERSQSYVAATDERKQLQAVMAGMHKKFVDITTRQQELAM